MPEKNKDIIVNKLVSAFLKNKLIFPIPSKYTKKLHNANKFRKICESKIDKPISGYKAGGTGIPLLKKLKEKEPFYATVYSHNVIKNNQKVKINNYTLGIELEVCFLISKNFFQLKKKVSKKNMKKYLMFIAPCIEIVGYRQRKKGIKSFGDLASDFGGNIKFILGKKKRFKNNKISNLKTIISNKRINQYVYGNTNTVYNDPMNALLFVMKKIQKDQILLNKDFYIFTGSTVGVVPILGKGKYNGKIDKIGSVNVLIN